jgi:hypothetical protein
MKKLTLLATTAMVLTISPVMAGENQSWIDTMTTSVQNWWSGNDQATEVEAYLDEVTIAVPPMTGEEAAQIQPAAGDYVDTIEDELMNDAPVMNAPGSMMDDEQSFNTDFTNETVTAFDDNVMSADDLANIMPAAGDAEEITDEAIIVAEDMVEETMDTASETMDAMQETAETMMDEMVQPAVETQVEEVVETPVVAEKIEAAMDAPQETVMEEVEEAMTETIEPAAGVVDAMTETIADESPMANDVMDAAHDMMDDHGHDH